MQAFGHSWQMEAKAKGWEPALIPAWAFCFLVGQRWDMNKQPAALTTLNIATPCLLQSWDEIISSSPNCFCSIFCPSMGKLIQWPCYSWTTFGSRLLILQCSEAFPFLTGLLIYSDFIPVHKRNGFCVNFHMIIHTCTILRVSPSTLFGLAVCSCHPISHPFFSTPFLWDSYFPYLVQVCCWAWRGCLIKDTWIRAFSKSCDIVKCTLQWREQNHFQYPHGHEWSCVWRPQNWRSPEQPALRTSVDRTWLDHGPVITVLTDGSRPKSQENTQLPLWCEHCQVYSVK